MSARASATSRASRSRRVSPITCAGCIPPDQVAQTMKAKRRAKSPEEINAGLAAKKGPVSKFIAKNYRHFNAAALLDAANGYEAHLAAGGKMLMTLAGAMSTAELGISLAEMIRRDKVHLIVCTGANLEEDIC